jgi:zinc and cadmium transporter
MIALISLASVLSVSVLSFLGIFLFLLDKKFIQKILLYVVSFSTGALLGDVFFHMLPDMAEKPEFFSQAMQIILTGILFSFAMEKFIHWRHCHVLPEEDHDHHHALGYMSLAGESMHNFVDGIVIAVSFLVSMQVGISTTIAIALHEIPHEIGNVAVLLHSGFTMKKAFFYNLLSAATGIVGAALVLTVSSAFSSLEMYLLPFAAGNLFYIAGSDLIPELHKQTRLSEGIIQLITMVCGMAFLYLMLSFE